MNKSRTPLRIIFVTLTLDVMGFGIITPALPKLFSDISSTSLAEASTYGGWWLSIYAVMQFLFSPLLGNLSDAFGRRPILLASLLCLSIDYLFLLFAPTMGWLFVGRIIAGSVGANFATASAYIADISTPEKRTVNFGLISAAVGIGFIVGPAIGGMLAGFGARVPFAAAAILVFANWICAMALLPESLSVENRRKFEWKRANPFGSLKFMTRQKLVAGLVITVTLVEIASFSVQSTWPYYTSERFAWDEKMIGYSLSLAGVLVLIVQTWVIGWMVPKFGNVGVLYAGFFFSILGFFLLGIATQGWMMFFCLLPYCLGGIVGPALQSILTSLVPSNEQGELQGALASVVSLTSIAGPLLMTYLFFYFSSNTGAFIFPGGVMFIGGLATALALWCAAIQLRKLKPNNTILAE